MTPELVVAIVAGIGSFTALLKAITDAVKVKTIQMERKASAESLEVWKREVEMKLNSHDESLRAGNERFDKADSKIDQLSQKMDSQIDRLSTKMDRQSSKIDNLIGVVYTALGKRPTMPNIIVNDEGGL